MARGGFDAAFGWNETEMTDLTDEEVAPALADHRIIVRRIRGKTAATDVTLADKIGSGSVVDIANAPTLALGNHDIPGLEIRTRIGAALIVSSSGADSGPLTIQWAYEPAKSQASWAN